MAQRNAMAKDLLPGFIATAPMTAVALLGRSYAPDDPARPLPPHEITEEVVERAPDLKGARSVARDLQPLTTLLAHFGFGALAALPYVRLRTHVKVRHSGLLGSLYGLGVWALAYGGLLHRAKLQPKPSKQPAGRNLYMILAHLVWGFAVDGCAKNIAKKGR